MGLKCLHFVPKDMLLEYKCKTTEAMKLLSEFLVQQVICIVC